MPPEKSSVEWSMEIEMIGECLFILVLPGKALRTLVESQGLPRERSGSVVQCLTQNRGARGSSLTGVTALWCLSKTNLS